MAKNLPAFKNTPIYLQIKRFSNLLLIQSAAAAIWLLALPKEPAHAVLLGYSLKRFALLLPIFMLPAAAFMVIYFLVRSVKMQEYVQLENQRAKTARLMIAIGALITMVIWIFAFFFYFLRWSEDIGIYMRLLPMLVSYFVFGIEVILFVPMFLFKGKRSALKTKLNLKSPIFLVSLGILLALFIVIEVTGLGKSPVWVSTTTLGIPLLEGHIWFLVGVIALLLIVKYTLGAVPGAAKWDSFKHKDIVIFFFLWLIALMIWMSLPLPEHNYFAPSVRPPTFEKYPFSDAEQYDYNSLYVYFGSVQYFVVSKPLYVSFLALLHFIGGFSYGTTILLQTIVLAFFPSVLFLIGKELHSRLGGFGIAVLAILREVNAIQASTISNVSNSKLLLSDLPATLVVAIMVLVIIRWFKRSDKKAFRPVFILGGLTALLNLMRIQTLTLIPFVLLLIILRYFKKPKKILLGAAVFILTVGVLLAPTLIRNHSITGVYWLDNPSSSQRLYTKFLDDENTIIEVPEAETRAEIVQRNLTVISSAIINNFGSVFYNAVDNYFRNLISTFLILPVRLGDQIPLINAMRITDPFWSEVYSQSNFLNLIVVLVNILILALGYAAVHKRSAWAAGMTLLVYLVYNLSSAFVRLSGWRFIQPVDWILIVFFVIGLIEIIMWITQRVFGSEIIIENTALVEDIKDETGSRRNLAENIFIIMVFFVSCAFIPFREALFPPLYSEISQPEICSEITSLIEGSEYKELAGSVDTFCSADDMRVLKGAGFYPRFFKAGDGYYTRAYDPYFGKQDYARLAFRVVGQPNGKIFIKTEQSNMKFEDGALVYALGRDKPKEGALLVIIASEQPQIILSTPILEGEDTFLMN